MTEITLYNKWFKSEKDYTQANILNALKDALDLSENNGTKPIATGTVSPVRCITCGCTLVKNECERCDKVWNDLGSTLYEMGNEQPEW